VHDHQHTRRPGSELRVSIAVPTDAEVCSSSSAAGLARCNRRPALARAIAKNGG